MKLTVFHHQLLGKTKFHCFLSEAFGSGSSSCIHTTHYHFPEQMSNLWTLFHSQFGCLLDECGRCIVGLLGCHRCTRRKLICSENSSTKLSDTKWCSFSCQNLTLVSCLSFEFTFKCNVVISMLLSGELSMSIQLSY